MIFLIELKKAYKHTQIVKGAAQFKINGICKPGELKKAHLCFVKSKLFWNEFQSNALEFSAISTLTLVLEESFKQSLEESGSDEDKKVLETIGAIIAVPSVDESMCYYSKPFYDLHIKPDQLFESGRERHRADIDNSAHIANDVFIGCGVKIAAGVQIMSGAKIMANSKIGKNTIIYPNAVIYPKVEIGNNCRIHSHATIGADGFGYNFINGKHIKIWHFGGVKIGNDVEVGANSCIDGGTFQPTIVSDGCKLDNHVQVGHNVFLGKHVVLCGHVAIGGSTKLEDYCVLGGKAGAGPGIHLGAGCQLAGGTLAHKNWPAGSKLGGYPAIEMKQWVRSVAKFKTLGDRKEP